MDYEETSIHSFNIEDDDSDIEKEINCQQSPPPPEISDEELITKYLHAVKCLRSLKQSDGVDQAWQNRMIGLLSGMMEDCLCD